jgi:selenocysteine lyase/cysteine desulfurase
MDIDQLLTDETLRQHEFPVARETVFLAHAAVCPLPRRVAEAIAGYAIACRRGDQEDLLPDGEVRQVRDLAARLVQARPEEIAFVGPTSLALSYVAGGLDWQRGDNVVVYRDDYPSNVYPWQALAARGVEVRSLRARALGEIAPEDVRAQVDERTRLVALASCHFVAGYRLDLDTIGQGLHERGVLFCVDAIQTLGAFPTQVTHVDCLAADAHKWLLGPCAAGILYVRQELQERLRPIVWGWHNLHCPNFVAQEELVWRTDARRYEAGSQNLLGLVGLRAALELILETGVEAIAAELRRKRAWLVPALLAKGYTVLHADAPAAQVGGIISCYRPGISMAELHQRLRAARVLTSLRTDRGGQQYLRLSPHFYNTDTELQRLLDRL